MFHSDFERALENPNLPRVPDFQKGLDWFNAPPLSFEKELKGKIVVLDFWCYCCINCIHVLPDLSELEAKYADKPVAFVGVHSPKFSNEQISEHIRDAVLRYEIKHPVVNDYEMVMWQQLGVRSWPTFAIVGPEGHLLFMISGEGHKKTLETIIDTLLSHYHEFNYQPLPYKPEKNTGKQLLYPGKVTFDEAGKQLFISDSNHNRILVVSPDGEILDAIGSGKRGSENGSFEEASFNRPQGVAFLNDKLYIADTENHLLRMADLKKKTVSTLAGNGLQGQDRAGGKKGEEQALSTPWDIAADKDNNRLFIAMAGTHQIWVHDLKSGVTQNFSGTGAELNLNSDNLQDAAWSQPSGLALAEGMLYIADSESSAIRAIDLIDGVTMTIAGGDPSNPANLFAFGDREGQGFAAKLQHPLGVAWHRQQQMLFIADSYNHKIKILDPASEMVRTVEPVFIDAPNCFKEPAGLAVSRDGKSLYIADTNTHLIRIMDLESGEVRNLNLNERTIS